MTLTIIVLVLLFLLTAYTHRRKAQAAAAAVVSDTKILVCSLRRETPEGFEDADARVYAKYYRHVEVAKGRQPDDFINSIDRTGYDVIHLYCELDEEGDMAGPPGSKLKASAFFDACRRADVKLLFIASENVNENYINMGRQQPKDLALDIVRTIGRNGESFTSFLGELLGRMSTGKTLPQAWVEIAPQSERAQQHMQLPATYCSVGRAAVLLP